jgi:hypothetical protein
MAGQNGGARKGAGRKPSTLTIRTREIAEKAIKGGETTPLEYMLQVMRDDGESGLMRFEAAKAAAPYIHPRLNAIEHTGTMHMTHEQMLAMLAADPEDPDADDAVRAETTH